MSVSSELLWQWFQATGDIGAYLLYKQHGEAAVGKIEQKSAAGADTEFALLEPPGEASRGEAPGGNARDRNARDEG